MIKLVVMFILIFCGGAIILEIFSGLESYPVIAAAKLSSVPISDWLTMFIATLGVYGVIVTLEAQHQPFLTPLFYDPDLTKGDEIGCLLGRKESWFTLKNSGNSPAIVTKLNRGWLAVPKCQVENVKPKSVVGENSRPKHLVAGPGGCTDQLKALIFLGDTEDNKDKHHYLERVDAAKSKDKDTEIFFMVAMEFKDVLGNKYISHAALCVRDGSIHQQQSNPSLNFSRRKCLKDNFLEILDWARRLNKRGAI